MRRFLIRTALLLLPAALLPIGACSAQPPVSDILPMIEGREWSIDQNRLGDLDPDTDLTLMAIARDESRPGHVRFRAIQALRLFPKERVIDYLEEVLGSGVSVPLQMNAVECLAAGFSEAFPARVETSAGGLLTHPNPHIRVRAARMLRDLGTSTSMALYRQHLGAIELEWERAQSMQ